MTCKRCNTPLTGQQTSYCSPRCSKLHLKSLYRKRRAEADREFRQQHIEAMQEIRKRVYESEQFAIDVIADHVGVEPERIKHMSAMNETHPIDLELHNLTFDVKYSSPTFDNSAKTMQIWDFDIRNKEDYCDYFILIGMENGRPLAVFAVPGEVAPTRHLRVSIQGSSKWHSYKIWGKDFPDNGLSMEDIAKAKPTRLGKMRRHHNNTAYSSPLPVSSGHEYGQGIEHFLHNPL